jgi:hypothetical protein
LRQADDTQHGAPVEKSVDNQSILIVDDLYYAKAFSIVSKIARYFCSLSRRTALGPPIRQSKV